MLKERNCEGGGVVLYINDVFKFKRRDDLCDSNVECIWAEITPPHMCTMLVCAVYNPQWQRPSYVNSIPWDDIKSCDNDALDIWENRFNDVIDYHRPSHWCGVYLPQKGF